MSLSLAIVNGDLVVGGNRAFQTVSDSSKLAQDLMLWMLEKIGTDPSTPTYGSTLDGGVINGQAVPSYIGQIISDQVILEIQNEVLTLVQQYQAMQFAKMQAEILAYNGLTTLAQDEVVETINSVNATAVGTQVLVQVILTTIAGTSLQLTVPVSGISS